MGTRGEADRTHGLCGDPSGIVVGGGHNRCARFAVRGVEVAEATSLRGRAERGGEGEVDLGVERAAVVERTSAIGTGALDEANFPGAVGAGAERGVEGFAFLADVVGRTDRGGALGVPTWCVVSGGAALAALATRAIAALAAACRAGGGGRVWGLGRCAEGADCAEERACHRDEFGLGVCGRRGGRGRHSVDLASGGAGASGGETVPEGRVLGEGELVELVREGEDVREGDGLVAKLGVCRGDRVGEV